MSPDEYVAFYTSIQTISLHRETDLNKQCLRAVIERVADYQNHNILDAGCGNGYLTRLIADSNPACRVVGFDQQTPRSSIPDNFYIGSMHDLPFADNEFDVVICAHVLEHCLNLDQAISELKRVCKTELIIVVPKQRPYFYTVDEHINFFYYEELLTTAVGLKNFTCKNLRGDWFYSGLIPAK